MSDPREIYDTLFDLGRLLMQAFPPVRRPPKKPRRRRSPKPRRLSDHVLDDALVADYQQDNGAPGRDDDGS